MTSEKLNRWLQIAGTIGVLGGLLLVMLQLRQNSELLKTQLLYDESQRLTTLEMSVIGEDGAAVWAKSIREPENLTLAELRVIEAYLWSFVEQLRAAHMLGEIGLLTDDEWRLRVRSESAFYLANPYARAWWRNFAVGNIALPPELVDAISERLDEAPADFVIEYFEAIRSGFGAKDPLPDLESQSTQ